MNPDCTQGRWRLNECFRLRFQRQLADYWSRHGSAAEGFGVIWEQTLTEVPVDELAQGQLYRELIDWAKNGEISTVLNKAYEAVPVPDLVWWPQANVSGARPASPVSR